MNDFWDGVKDALLHYLVAGVVIALIFLVLGITVGVTRSGVKSDCIENGKVKIDKITIYCSLKE